jgi:hypothetical protein
MGGDANVKIEDQPYFTATYTVLYLLSSDPDPLDPRILREEKEDAVHAASYEMGGGGGEDEDTLFINLDQGEGEEFFRPPEVEDGEEEEPPDLLGPQGKLYTT